MMRAKLCGIRSKRDLEIAIASGTDAIGLICGITHVSEDALSPDDARRLARLTPPFVSTVLVTHLLDATEIIDLADYVAADTIQVHGPVTTDTLASVSARARGRRIIKAVHVLGPEAKDQALQLAELCDAILVDSRTRDRLGGTGRTHDWTISRQVSDALRERNHPLILAGGLRPDNVAEAVRAVQPFAVDVNSGVDDENGDKIADRCAAFVSRAREALAKPVAPSP